MNSLENTPKENRRVYEGIPRERVVITDVGIFTVLGDEVHVLGKVLTVIGSSMV